MGETRDTRTANLLGAGVDRKRLVALSHNNKKKKNSRAVGRGRETPQIKAKRGGLVQSRRLKYSTFLPARSSHYMWSCVVLPWRVIN